MERQLRTTQQLEVPYQSDRNASVRRPTRGSGGAATIAITIATTIRSGRVAGISDTVPV